MPIYKMEGKKDGLQKYRVRVNYTDNSGKAKQLDRVAYGKEEARDLEMRLIHDLKNETVRKITVAELAEEFYSMKQYEVRESSLDKMKRRTNYYILPYVRDVRIDRLTVPVLQEWKRSVEEMRTSKQDPLSLRTKQSAYCEFRAILNYAVKMDYIPKNLLVTVGNFKDAYATKPKIDFYTADEFLAFISCAEKHAIESERKTGSIYEWNYYVFFMIAFYTGMRKGEIYALTWKDYDGTSFHITKSITQKLRGEDRITPPKNKNSVRDITLPAPLNEALKSHFSRYQSIAGFTNDWHIVGGQKCIRDTSVSNYNKSYADLAGMKSIRIHDFRHSHASYLAHCGINIQEIARRLGHTKVEITWNTYSHLYPKEEDRAVEALNKIVK